MSEAVSTRRSGRRLLLVARSAHPKQALFLGVVVAVLAALDGRSAKEWLVAGAAVLVVQLSLGLDNDLADAQHDYRAQTPRKPVASGALPAESASYAMYVLILLAIPVAAYNGGVAAAALLVTLPLGWLHNHWLHRTAFSFLAWTLTFALAPAFLAYGGWGGWKHGDAPTWAVTGAAAAVGFCWHLVTSLGDLVTDNKAGARNLPLRLALRVGAPRLLLVTIFLSAVAVAGLVAAVLGPGLRQ
jgi:4-hydroxybenzoate polyprenyltransferase